MLIKRVQPLLEIVNVVVPDLWILFLIAASVADAATVNPNGIKTLLADSLSMSFINVKPVFCNGARSLQRNPPSLLF